MEDIYGPRRPLGKHLGFGHTYFTEAHTERVKSILAQRMRGWGLTWGERSLTLERMAVCPERGVEEETFRVTFDSLSDLANALGTRLIDVTGYAEGGYYPGEDAAGTRIHIRWD